MTRNETGCSELRELRAAAAAASCLCCWRYLAGQVEAFRVPVNKCSIILGERTQTWNFSVNFYRPLLALKLLAALLQD